MVPARAANVCRPATRDELPAPDRWTGESQRDRDERAGFAVLFGDVNTCRRAAVLTENLNPKSTETLHHVRSDHSQHRRRKRSF